MAFLEILEDRHRRKSTMVISQQKANKGYVHWVFSDSIVDTRGMYTSDFVAEAFRAFNSADDYLAWVFGDIPFTDPRVIAAVNEIKKLLTADGWVFRGIQGVYNSVSPNAVGSLIAENEKRAPVMGYQPLNTAYRRDAVGVFSLPASGNGARDSGIIIGEIVVPLNELPETKWVFPLFASAEWYEYNSGWFIMSPHADADLDEYDESNRNMVDATMSWTTILPAFNFALPVEVQQAYIEGLVEYMTSDETNPEPFLSSVEAMRNAE